MSAENPIAGQNGWSEVRNALEVLKKPSDLSRAPLSGFNPTDIAAGRTTSSLAVYHGAKDAQQKNQRAKEEALERLRAMQTNIHVALALDLTGSMDDDLDAVRKNLGPWVAQLIGNSFKSIPGDVARETNLHGNICITQLIFGDGRKDSFDLRPIDVPFLFPQLVTQIPVNYQQGIVDSTGLRFGYEREGFNGGRNNGESCFPALLAAYAPQTREQAVLLQQLLTNLKDTAAKSYRTNGYSPQAIISHIEKTMKGIERLERPNKQHIAILVTDEARAGGPVVEEQHLNQIGIRPDFLAVITPKSLTDGTSGEREWSSFATNTGGQRGRWYDLNELHMRSGDGIDLSGLAHTMQEAVAGQIKQEVVNNVQNAIGLLPASVSPGKPGGSIIHV